MSLVKKLKDILFEVEDDETEPIKIKEEAAKEIPKKPEHTIVEIKKDELNGEFKRENVKETAELRKEEVTISSSERNLFNQENTFKFPDFDEEEFQSNYSRSKQNTNVLDIERKKNVEKRSDYRYERNENRDLKENGEKKKFKPSPIISPVYGILNQDYTADEIVNKNEVNNLDIDSVRKKAFESNKIEKLEVSTPNINDIIDDNNIEIPTKIEKDIEDRIEEPVVSFFDEKEEIIEKPQEEFKEIDELLEDAAEEISLEDTLEVPASNNLDVIEEELEKIDEETKNQDKEDLDNDLFELIDSMYDERKEG